MAPAVRVDLASTLLRPWFAMADGTATAGDDIVVLGDAVPGAAGATTPFTSGLDDLALDQKLERLIAEHGEAVYRVAVSVVRDPTAAEDVAQEALLKAWQALPSYRGEAPLRSWLLRITHNTAVSSIRRRREDPLDPALLPDHTPTGAGVAAADSPEHAVERRASMAAFETALAELDDLSRSIVVLRELEGMSYEDIAQLLDVPLPTVKTRLLRARRVLSVSLEGWRP